MVNKTKYPACLIVAAVVVFFANVARADNTTKWQGACKIQFAGSSTLHDWAGTVTSEPFETAVTLDDAGKLKSISALVEVKAADMDTDNKRRDSNIRSAMKTTQFPLVRGLFKNIPAERLGMAEAGASARPRSLPFTLELLGQPHKVRGAVSGWKVDGDKVSFVMAFPVSLAESGIVVPSVLGVIKVADKVSVRASVTLTRRAN
jgi:hypothetical protein